MKPKVGPSLSRVRVGSFELNLQTGELRSAAGDTILLREQPFQVLRMLVERDGKIVTRGEIKERLWPNDTIVDFDHSINVAIGVLRRAFGDSAATPRYIETLARRGYRLLTPVEVLESGPPPGGASVAQTKSQLGDLTGRKVCQYRVLEVLGGGGMGMVYRAEDLKLGRSAALKFLPEELAEDPIALQRLEREAQTASALNHPNICTIYDIEEHEGHPFIAMELLEGVTLQQRVAASASDAIPPIVVIDIAIQLCRGLEAAHSKAIIHRDIKPANIFLTNDGTAKLLDFGVAKLVASDDTEETAETQATLHSRPQEGLTRAGVAVGTSGYMSPEQVLGEDLDGRSDLFSLGLVLYEMTTGRRAFTGDTAVSVKEAILSTTPPTAGEVNQAVPGALSSIVARALEKDRSHRYQTAAEMREALERARQGLQRRETRVSPRWLAATAALLAIAAIGFWLWPRGGVVLAPSDTIVIAHLTNTTGDRVFDEALYTALRIGLEQTPYLNVLADNKVTGTLASLKLEPATHITPAVALQVCRQTGSRIVVAPSIAEAGNRFRVELSGIDCQSEAVISRIAHDAASRDGVVGALGISAVQLRTDLGEPESSVAKYNAPLEEATSRSPEALELLTQGYRRQLEGSVVSAIPFYERAVQADASFALALAALSTAYGNMSESARSTAFGQKAFEMRERLTAPARFNAESNYYSQVLGDMETTCTIRAQWVAAFPQDVVARNNLSFCLSVLGELDRALGESREVARLLPAAFTFRSLILRSMLVDRLDESQSTIDDALQRGFDSASLRDLQARLAFLRNDSTAMQEQWTWAAGRSGADLVIMGKALVEATHGQFRAALRSVETAAATATDRADAVEYAFEMALMQAEAGLSPAIRITIAPEQTFRARLLGTLALARMGRLADARDAADALRREFPSNTIVQKYGLPLIEGAVKLQSGEAGAAVELLKASLNHDLGYTGVFQPLYPAYVRGLAYLEAGEAGAAATEFQKLISRRGLVGRGVIASLATLQLARAQRALGNAAAAIGSYEAFLEFWRDADADVPLYAAAKAEYARLRNRPGGN